jgi:hypothetical protein
MWSTLGVVGLGSLILAALYFSARWLERRSAINHYRKNWVHYRPQDIPEGENQPVRPARRLENQ